MNLPRPPIFISYAWGQPDTEEYIVVNSLCEILSSLNIEYVRDIDYLKYLDNLPVFLKKIGSGGYVIAIVGGKYLHSENCMIEASYMAFKGNLETRVFPITLSSLKGVYNIESRTKLFTELTRYWADKESTIKEFLQEQKFPQGFISLRGDLSLISQLTNNISEFLRHIGTKLQITSQEHLDENFKRLIETINATIEIDYNEIKESIGLKGEGTPYYQRFSSEYIGRKENIDDVLKFLNN